MHYTGGLGGVSATDQNCLAIQCGILTKEQAGLDAFIECSRRGFSGQCNFPTGKTFVDCSVNEPIGPNGALVRTGEMDPPPGMKCGWNEPATPSPTRIPAIPAPPVMLKAETQKTAEDSLTREVQPPMPSITMESKLEAARQAMDAEGPICKINRWVSANPGLSLLGVIAIFLASSQPRAEGRR